MNHRFLFGKHLTVSGGRGGGLVGGLLRGQTRNIKGNMETQRISSQMFFLCHEVKDEAGSFRFWLHIVTVQLLHISQYNCSKVWFSA